MRVFVILLLLLALFCPAPTLAQTKNRTAAVDSLTRTISMMQDTLRSLRQEIRNQACTESFREDAARKAQSTLDCALKFHQIVLSTIALFFTLFAIAVAIFSGAGYFLTRNKLRELDALLKERKRDIDEKVGAVEDLVKEMVTKVANADQALKQIEETKENLEKDIADRQAKIGPVDISKPSSPADRAQLEELSRRVELLEALGGKLTAEDYEKRAVSYFFTGRFAEALAEINTVLELNPKSVSAWNTKGAVLGKLSRLQEAMQCFDAALGIKPDFHAALYNKAGAAALINDKQNMLNALAAAVKLNDTYRQVAKQDLVFKVFRDDPDFKKIVGE